MEIGTLHPSHVTEEALHDINILLSELRANASEHGATLSELKAIADDENVVCVIAQDGVRIIGMATLYVLQKFGKRVAHVEDVVVHSDYRGQGLGKAIMEEVIKVARSKDVRTLHLTSRPAREAANKLYQKLGFERKETNAYRLKLG